MYNGWIIDVDTLDDMMIKVYNQNKEWFKQRRISDERGRNVSVCCGGGFFAAGL